MLLKPSWILFLLMIKNLQRRRVFAGEHDFPIKTHTDQVYCLIHSRDQKFVTLLAQSAIGH